MPKPAARLNKKRLMDTRRDSADFRDRIYQPALVPLGDRLIPERERIVVLDQGTEGACTGFALAATINYLNAGRRVETKVSPRMLYEMAKRHDRWPGEDYEGSSARGAMKGWHKNGVCPDSKWPYNPDREGYFTRARQEAALQFPLGAYYRVLKKRSDMHAALQQTKVVFAAGAVHAGWDRVGRDGVIPDNHKTLPDGGHAFCIVGYNESGFIIQNSWGEGWGGLTIDGVDYPGLAVWKYADFDLNFWDGWVARMALPVESLEALASGSIVKGTSGVERVEKSPPRHEIANYYVHIDDGQFDPKGDYPSTREETRELIRKAVADMTGAAGGVKPGHIMLYAHGGLNSVKSSASRVGKWNKVLEANRVRQIHFIWETGLGASLKDILLGKDDFSSQRAGGFGDWKDRLIERCTQPVGYALWKEMREDADLAFAKVSQAGSQTIRFLAEALKAVPAAKRPRLHLVGHSAGSIWIGHLLQRWSSLGGGSIESLQLFAPACTMEFFESHLRPALGATRVKSLLHYLLDDETELNDNVGSIYGKSLLYLVSRAYQNKQNVVPIMGMEKHWDGETHDRITSYNTRDNPERSRSTSHGGFDNDPVTMNNALQVMLGAKPNPLFSEDDLKGY